ncbi:hypothetical protein [Gordonia polyisoprenivorans]|uniref:hypothetical protein n=1 Tax=Gordonia polyisoprenivorans TaxID=84595 RepID=UPI0022343071|nr:hypothetical protein [Gordonia polyisoprenivorans]UZF55199.1 hypothetical protein LH935_21080 [Gordonia polyisoprenivorans]WCB36371.1 hypothetical protein PHA63_20160 [Gordonia polyisoprenivorans]
MPRPRASIDPSRDPEDTGPTRSAGEVSAPASRVAQMVVPAVITLIVAQLIVRGWLVATGNFYWDDLILVGRASTMSIWSWDYLGHSHDGHFMPAAFLVAGISTVFAPLNWVAPAITLVVLQGLASVCVWRMIRVLTDPGEGRSRSAAVEIASVGALAFYLFTPLTVSSFVWWAAGLNTLPMQAAMAWIVADAVLLARGGADRRRTRLIVLRSSVIFVLSLAFFEKSLFILPVAFVAAVLVSRTGLVNRTGSRSADVSDVDADVDADESAAADTAAVQMGPLGTAFVHARRLWAPLSVIFVAWALLFFSVSDATAGQHSVSQTAQLVWRSINRGVIPSLVGGPWDWERWVPSPPMGFSAVWMVVLGWLVVAAVVIWAVRTRIGAVAVLVCAALYVVVAQIPVMWNRSSANTALELAQTLRYLPDSAVVLTAALALLVAAPRRSVNSVPPSGGRHAAPEADEETVGRGRTVGTAVGVLAAVTAVLAFASSLISTASYQSSWTDDPTGAYLANAKRALADNRDHTMFDQALPLEVLLPVAYPYNQISATFGRVTDRSLFGDTTDRLFVLDNAGNLTPGAVTPRRTVEAGRGTCARPELTGPTSLRLDGPLINWRWTIALGYCANAAGDVEMSLDGGPAVRVPLQAGLHVVYVQLDGHGTELRIRPLTRGMTLHTGDGRVGEVVDARLLGQ